MEVFREFTFEAAHSLPQAPEDHKCRRLHGHSYHLTVHVRGEVDAKSGWLIDFAEIKRVVQPLVDRLDHRLLNEIEGLENPTSEAIVRWMWCRLHPQLPGLAQLTLRETATSGCVYRGEDESGR